MVKKRDNITFKYIKTDSNKNGDKMDKEERALEIKCRLMAYEDAFSIADKSITRKEIKRHLKLRIEEIRREEECFIGAIIKFPQKQTHVNEQ